MARFWILIPPELVQHLSSKAEGLGGVVDEKIAHHTPIPHVLGGCPPLNCSKKRAGVWDVRGHVVEENTLPFFCQARILILGVGNVLFGDDGFGPAVAEALNQAYQLPRDVCVLDAGTGVRKVLFTILLSESRPSEIVILDAVDWGQTAGEVFEVPIQSLPAAKIDDFSMHQLPTSNMLRELQELCGIRVRVVACDVGQVPQMIQPGLSAEVQNAVQSASEMIASFYPADFIKKAAILNHKNN